MPHIGLTYALCLPHALRRFSGLTRADVQILHTLDVLPAAPSYNYLFDCIASISLPTFNISIHRLVDLGYINRRPVNNTVQYSITQQGISLLALVSLQLDEIVKDIVINRLPKKH